FLLFYTLLLHDALPICIHCHLDLGYRGRIEGRPHGGKQAQDLRCRVGLHRIIDLRVGQGAAERVEIVADHFEVDDEARSAWTSRSEEHTSELQSRENLV